MITAESVPEGNQWNILHNNTAVSVLPEMEIQKPGEVDERLQRLVDGIREIYIVDSGWLFQSIIGNEHFFVVVFCNPTRSELSEHYLKGDFLNPEQRITNADSPGNKWDLQSDGVADLLKGTNLYPYSLYGMYNEIGAKKIGNSITMGYADRVQDRLCFYQTGIALIRAQLCGLEEAKQPYQDKILGLSMRFAHEVEPLEREISAINSRKVTYPRALFPTQTTTD